MTKPVSDGGLGFTFKWNMGWMHDTLAYFALDPVHRRFHHDQLTFAMLYEYSEHFIMPLSHDEVVHLKGSLFRKMPGDEWQKLANLRLLLAYMFTRPGKKLLFMGTELAPWTEWNHDASLDWHLLDDPQRAAFVAFRRRARVALQARTGVLARRPELGRLPLDRRRRSSENSVISYVRRAGDVARGRRAQPHAGAARALSHRCSDGRPVRRAAVERRRAMGWQRLRRFDRVSTRAVAVPRLRAIGRARRCRRSAR